MSVERTVGSVSLAGPSQQIVFDHSHDGCVVVDIWLPGHFDSLGSLPPRVLPDLTFRGIFWRIAVETEKVESIEDKSF